MKREVEREIRVTAFSLERGDLELIWKRLMALFDPTQSIRKKIAIQIPSEKLTFESIEELLDYSSLRGIVTKFSIEMRQGQREVTLSSGSMFSNTPTLKVEGESDIWCAGALEAVNQVVSQRRVWYYWMMNIPYTLIFILMLILPWLKIGPFSNFPNIAPPLMFSWIIAMVFFGYFSQYRNQVLPAASIVFSKDLGFFRRYAGELGLFLGVLAILMSLYMWMVPYGT